MKLLNILLFIMINIGAFAQEAVIIDHQCVNINHIPEEWINTAKENLHIGYGHTSHGSQLTSGMNALETFYTNGLFDWSHSGGPGQLHLFEGAGYGTGYLELDCGYEGWEEQTRTYLNDHPDCNVIIWSWCGQVNNVDLQSHYLQPMSDLETDYPDVQFVYMTGHLEGLGPEGSLFEANQQIRDYCTENNKILFDFADIEKYSPEADTNFMEYFANDACDYQHPGGGTANWAYDWLNNNPDHTLTEISALCSSCSHSVSLNCVKKGIACWFLWARLAGWNGQITRIDFVHAENSISFNNPVEEFLNFTCAFGNAELNLEIRSLNGSLKIEKKLNSLKSKNRINVKNLKAGIYLLCLRNNNTSECHKMIKL